MAEDITKDSDPALWALLYNSYMRENEPRDVYRGKTLFKVIELANKDIIFRPVDTLEYLDSRSIKGSKKATYKNLMDK
jgi:hypothetical protein